MLWAGPEPNSKQPVLMRCSGDHAYRLHPELQQAVIWLLWPEEAAQVQVCHAGCTLEEPLRLARPVPLQQPLRRCTRRWLLPSTPLTLHHNEMYKAGRSSLWMPLPSFAQALLENFDHLRLHACVGSATCGRPIRKVYV